MRRLVIKALPLIEDDVRLGVTLGTETARAQFIAAYSGAPVMPAFATSAEQMALAGARLRGDLYVDKIPLSKRLWNNAAQTSTGLTKEIQSALRAGESMEAIAKTIMRKSPPAIQMPKYIAEIQEAAKDAARLGQPNLLTDAVKKYQRQIDKLGSSAGPLFDARANTRRFLTDVRGATEKQIDEHARRYVNEKARQHAVTVARTETIHSYRDGYYKSVKGKPWNKGIRWNLGDSHPKPDICDVLANQDVHGLGPGGYPMSAIPENPHPNCMCYQTAIIDRDHFKRQQAKRDGKRQPPKRWESGKKQTGSQWLRTKSERYQRDVLGPTRAKALKRAPDKVMDKRTGKINRVRDLPSQLRR